MLNLNVNKNTIAKAETLISIDITSVLNNFEGTIKFSCLKFTNEFNMKSSKIEVIIVIPTPKMLKYFIKTKFKIMQIPATIRLIAVST